MSTKAKGENQDTGGGAVLGALLLAPVGWLADTRPVPLAERRPYGDGADSAAAQMSALMWAVAAAVVAVVVHDPWWVLPAVVAMLLLILPTRTAAGRGGSLVVPTPTGDPTRAPRGRLAVTAWALGLAAPGAYAAVDRRERDPEGTRGRRSRRIRALLLVVLPTALLVLDAATSGAVVSDPLTGAWSMEAGPVVVTLPAVVRAVLALVIVAALGGSTSPLGAYHAEDLQITGTARYPGLAARLAAALGVSISDFDTDSELHWNRHRRRSEGFHARSISGRVAAALLEPERREKVAKLFPEWELEHFDHASFRLAPVTTAERARRDALAATEGLVAGVAGGGTDTGTGGWQEPIALDADGVDWEG